MGTAVTASIWAPCRLRWSAGLILGACGLALPLPTASVGDPTMTRATADDRGARQVVARERPGSPAASRPSPWQFTMAQPDDEPAVSAGTPNTDGGDLADGVGGARHSGSTDDAHPDELGARRSADDAENEGQRWFPSYSSRKRADRHDVVGQAGQHRDAPARHRGSAESMGITEGAKARPQPRSWGDARLAEDADDHPERSTQPQGSAADQDKSTGIRTGPAGDLEYVGHRQPYSPQPVTDRPGEEASRHGPRPAVSGRQGQDQAPDRGQHREGQDTGDSGHARADRQDTPAEIDRERAPSEDPPGRSGNGRSAAFWSAHPLTEQVKAALGLYRETLPGVTVPGHEPFKENRSEPSSSGQARSESSSELSRSAQGRSLSPHTAQRPRLRPDRHASHRTHQVDRSRAHSRSIARSRDADMGEVGEGGQQQSEGAQDRPAPGATGTKESGPAETAADPPPTADQATELLPLGTGLALIGFGAALFGVRLRGIEGAPVVADPRRPGGGAHLRRGQWGGR